LNARVIKISSKNLLEHFKHKYSLNDKFDSKFNAIELTNVKSSTSQKIKSLFSEIGSAKVCDLNSDKDLCSMLLPLSFSNLQAYKDVFSSTGLTQVFDCLDKSIKNYLKYDDLEYTLPVRKLIFEKSYVMGILNVTPDSFSDGGDYFDHQKAIAHARQMIIDGADLIDIGGESTRPGSEIVDLEVELKRVIPVIEAIRKDFHKVVISVDTTKSKVAELALEVGADIVNDISGATFDENMLDVINKFNAGLVIMHIKGNPKTMQNNPYYSDTVSEVYDFLVERTKAAELSGIKNIIVDPGIGFGKRISDNYQLINRLEEFKSIGYPILIGVSKKSFLGKSLDLDIDQRENATVCTESISMNNGARIIRTHNVKKAAEAVKIFNYTNSFGQLVDA
jgi:dihydropteroate synthase